MTHVRTRKIVENSRLAGIGRGLNAHQLVAETAVEMAQELFEAYAKENAIYHRLRADGSVTEKDARRFFVLRMAPRLLEDARRQLAACLAEPGDRVSETMKQKIYEALTLDNDLRANRLVAEGAAMSATVH